MAIDRRQRQRLGIWEFSQDPDCIFRLRIASAHIGAELADGTVVRPGDTIGEIHAWNERVPHIPPDGPGLTWAKSFRRVFVHSFRLMARHIVENATLADIQAFGGELPFVYTPASTRLLRRMGLEVFDPVPPDGLAERATDLGARLWSWLLRRAFNPASVRGLRPSDIERRPTWISRRTLIALHGSDDKSQ